MKYKMVSSTRLTGSGEIAKSNQRFKMLVQVSGNMSPKYGQAKNSYESKKKLEQLFN